MNKLPSPMNRTEAADTLFPMEFHEHGWGVSVGEQTLHVLAHDLRIQRPVDCFFVSLAPRRKISVSAGVVHNAFVESADFVNQRAETIRVAVVYSASFPTGTYPLFPSGTQEYRLAGPSNVTARIQFCRPVEEFPDPVFTPSLLTQVRLLGKVRKAVTDAEKREAVEGWIFESSMINGIPPLTLPPLGGTIYP